MLHLRLLIAVLLYLVSSFTSAQLSNCKVSVDATNQSLTNIFESLSKQCNVHFAYDSYVVRNIRVTDISDQINLFDFLQKILVGHQLSYKVIDNTIVIFQLFENSNITSDSIDNPILLKQQFVFSGEIRSRETDEVLPFANVQVMGSHQGTASNADGKFILILDSLLNDSIEISYVGFEPIVIAAATAKSRISKKWYLEERKNYLPSIIIETDRIRLLQMGPQPSQLLVGPKDLAIIETGGEPDVMRAAQLLPGISATQETSSGLYIRASGSDQILITMDGFTLYHLDHFFGAFSALNANAVKTMRIMKGALPAEYGGRLAGVVEVIGKEGNLNKTSAQIDLSTMSIGGVIESPLGKKKLASIIVAGRRSFTDLLYSPPYKNMFNTTYNSAIVTSSQGPKQTFNETEDPQFYFNDVNLKLTLRPSEKTLLNLSAYAGKDHLFISFADTTDNELLNLSDKKYLDESTWLNRGIGLRWNTQWNQKLATQLTAGLSKFETVFFTRDSTINPLLNPPLFERSSFINETTSVNDFNLKWTSIFDLHHHQLKAGVQYNVINTERALGIDMPINFSKKQVGHIAALFIHDDWKVSKKWLLTAGMRVAFYDLLAAKLFPEPRLNLLRTSKSGNLVWKFSATRVHQFIHRIRAQSLYLNNPDYWKLSVENELPVKISDQVVAGFIVKKGKVKMDVEAYLKSNKNNTIYLNAFNGYSENSSSDSLNVDNLLIGNGLAYGTDVMLQYDHGIHHAWVAYSALRASSRYSVLDKDEVPESFVENHEFKIYYEVEAKKMEFSLLWVYGSGKAYTPYLGNYNFELPDGEFRKIPVFGNLNSARLPDYHRLDLAVSYQFVLGNARGKIKLSCFNLYNRKNIRDRQYLVQRTGQTPNDFDVLQRDIQMLGILPSLSIQFKF